MTRRISHGYSSHRQVEASRATVDEGMVDLLEAVWAAGMDTQFSCQGYPPDDENTGEGYVAFPTMDDAVQFIRTTSERTPLYVCLSMRLGPPWGSSGPPSAAVYWPHDPTPKLTAAWTTEDES